MSTQTAPAIPARPSRSPQQQGLAPSSISNMPSIPPRPNRRIERSVSPLRDSYAPSPLNVPPNSSSISPSASVDLPQRPPSVTIPSLGEEGIEYADLDQQVPTPAETRNVGSDLKIHAPKPSLPLSSAKARVQAVTRTDSRQAAAVGLGTSGSPGPDEHQERPTRSQHSRAGSRADSTASSDRRRSLQLGDEYGIPEIGQRVPMYRNAGDVQAPSPSPYQTEFSGQRSGRNHNRTRSGREASLPPGSYGLHGHGVPSQDRFEKAWYEKHPEEYVKEEHGQYGPGVGTSRPDWALSSDDLNKIVRGSAVTGAGLGTSPAVTGTPEEEVGYLASDEYTHRMASPAPDSRRHSRRISESALRNANLPSSEADTEKEIPAEDEALYEDAGVIHVNDPYHPLHHPDGFASTPGPDEQSHRLAEGDEDEEPILAADETRPEAAYQHPAVSPAFDRNGSVDHEGRSTTPSANQSRSNSRPSMPTLARYNSREEREETTPLEDVEEYEPLFPDDDKKEKKPAAERFKQRPEMPKQRFPSEDIWEDSPDSLQLHATVTTPDQGTFETPEQESSRRNQAPQVNPQGVATQILGSGDQDAKATSRPQISRQRFPSRDIWEDAPESHNLVTTIEPSGEDEVKSPEASSKPTIPSRPQKRQPPGIPDRPKPQIPSRPVRSLPRGSAEEPEEVASKTKPAVPTRPGGNKIAALKAGFLSDLNSRLQLGPQAPKPVEKDETPAEKQPLSDARKGRARGPARRKPATETIGTKLPTIPEIKITETWNVWQVGQDGNLVVGATITVDEPKSAAPDVSDSTMAPPLSKNMAGESTDSSPSTLPEEGVSAPEVTETAETISSTDDKVNIPPAVEPATEEEAEVSAISKSQAEAPPGDVL